MRTNMRAIRQGRLLSALSRRHQHTSTTGAVAEAPTAASAADLGPLLTFPTFQAEPFPTGKFLSIKSRTPDSYLDVRRDLLARSRALETQIAQLMASSSSAGTVSSQDEVSLDAYTALPAKATDELLAADTKAKRLEATQGFTLGHAEVYQMLLMHTQCGSFDLAVHDWLLKRIIGESRGPPYPLCVCHALATLLQQQCLPRLPDNTQCGVLWLSRLETAAAALADLQCAVSADGQPLSATGGGDGGGAVEGRDDAVALADVLCRTTLSSSALPVTGGAGAAEALLHQYTKLVETSLARPDDTNSEADVEASEYNEPLLVEALRRVIARASAGARSLDAESSLEDESDLDVLEDILTLDKVMRTSAASSLTSSTRDSHTDDSRDDPFSHSARLVQAVRGGLVQGTHPYPLHLLGTWLLPLWQACSGLNLFLTDSLPLLNRNTADNAAASVDSEEAGHVASGVADDAPPTAMDDDPRRLFITDADALAASVRRLLMSFTPLHTPFDANAPTQAVHVPREDRRSSSVRGAATTTTTATTTIPVAAPLDERRYGPSREALMLGPLRAVTTVLLLLAEAAAALKEAQLLTALQVAFCGIFVTEAAATAIHPDGPALTLATDAWSGVLGQPDTSLEPAATGDDDEPIRAAVTQHLTQFAKDFIATTAYAKQSCTTDATLWSVHDQLSVIACAVSGTQTDTVDDGQPSSWLPDGEKTRTSTAAAAPLALALVQLSAQHRVSQGAAHVSSRVDKGLSSCLTNLSAALQHTSPESWQESAALYMASASCNTALFDSLAQAGAGDSEAVARRRLQRSISTRARWRVAVLEGDDVAETSPDTDMWLEWLDTVRAATKATPRDSTGPAVDAQDLEQALNGAVEYLIYHYATRTQREMMGPAGIWAAQFLGMTLPDEVHKVNGVAVNGEDDADGWCLSTARAWWVATQRELLGQVAALVDVLDAHDVPPASLQPSTMASIAVLVSAGLPPRTSTTVSSSAHPDGATNVTERGHALLERLSAHMARLLQDASTATAARAGNAPSVLLLCLARAGLWDAVSSLLRLATAPPAGSTSPGASKESWSSATTLDSVVLAEVFTRARDAGAAIVCVDLRQLRETVFF